MEEVLGGNPQTCSISRAQAPQLSVYSGLGVVPWEEVSLTVGTQGLWPWGPGSRGSWALFRAVVSLPFPRILFPSFCPPRVCLKAISNLLF